MRWSSVIMDDFQLQQLTANLTYLTYLSVQFDGVLLNTHAIVKLIRNHEELQRFDVINSSKHSEEAIKVQLREEWDACSIKDGMSFRRKMN